MQQGVDDAILIRDIKLAMVEAPELLPEILTAVSSGLTAFVALHESKRDCLAHTVVNVLLLSVKFEGVYATLPYLIDIAFHQFPRGPDGCSPVERDFWDLFIDVARTGVDREWLNGVKGYDYACWWNDYVLPSIIVRKLASRPPEQREFD
jgi:hypothetical protein